MRKKFLVVATCACLMFSLSACSKKENDTDINNIKESIENKEDTDKTDDKGSTEKEENASDVKVTLGQYKGIEVTLQPTGVTDEEVQQQLDSFNQSKGTPVKVTDRTDVRDGDTVNIDYVGKIDGKEFAGGADKGYNLKIGSKTFIDGFEDGLIGKKVGKTVDVEATFPKEYKNNPDLAGKKAVFTVTINYITTGEMEPLTDAIVAANTEDYKTIEEFKAGIRTDLKKQKEDSANSQKELDIMTKAIENTKFEGITQKELDDEQATLKAYFENMTKTSYNMDLKTYLGIFGMTEEDFDKQLKERAEFDVKQKYMLKEIIKKENITLSDKEFDKLIADYMADTDYTEADKFIEAVGGKEKAMESLQMDKAIDLIMDSAVVVKGGDTKTDNTKK